MIKDELTQSKLIRELDMRAEQEAQKREEDNARFHKGHLRGSFKYTLPIGTNFNKGKYQNMAVKWKATETELDK